MITSGQAVDPSQGGSSLSMGGAVFVGIVNYVVPACSKEVDQTTVKDFLMVIDNCTFINNSASSE